MRQQKPRPDDINERALVFVCHVLDFVPSISPRPGSRRVADPLVDAAGGIGDELLDEGQQIARIIAAIVINTKRNGL